MSTQRPMPDPAATDEPLVNFSQCHIGITRQLQALAELPPLLEPAAKARRIARETVAFFRGAVHEHHAEEENELFPAVLASAQSGAERDQVLSIVDRLVVEHRRIEAMWARLEPALLRTGVSSSSSSSDWRDCRALATAVGALGPPLRIVLLRSAESERTVSMDSKTIANLPNCLVLSIARRRVLRSMNSTKS